MFPYFSGLADPRAVQERVAELVARYPSDDAFAEAVNERFGTRLTRQMVIRWRTGQSRVSRQWSERLAEFADEGTADDWRSTPLPWKERMERRIGELERRLDELLRRRNG